MHRRSCSSLQTYDVNKQSEKVFRFRSYIREKVVKLISEEFFTFSFLSLLFVSVLAVNLRED